MRATLLFVLLVSATLGAAQSLPPGVLKGPTLAGVTEYDYPNGLTVLLIPDPGASTTYLNVTYLVGSRHEGYGESGMAHLLEHMNFILSTSGRDIKKELNDHGARWDGTTSFDRTNYFETFNASDENLRWALGLEAERMVNMRIEKTLLDTEMTVVRNEFERGENNPSSVLNERVMSTAFLWHNYGKSPIGSRADIERVPVDRLAAFYKKYYQPDNAVVTIAGKLDPAATLALVGSTLGALPRPGRTLDPTYTVEPVQDGERSVVLRRVGRGQYLMLSWHTPAMSHPDSAALEVLSGILARGGTGRLDRFLVDAKKALSVAMGNDELHDPGLTSVRVTLSDTQSLDEAKTIALDTLASIVTTPPTDEDIDRARSSIVQRMARMFDDAQALGADLNEVIADGDWRLLFANYEELRRVTAADVVRVAKTYFKPSNLTVGEFIPDAAPDRADVPEGESITKLMETYTPTIRVADGEAIPAVPSAIEARVHRPAAGPGVHLVLLPKDTRGGRVQARLTIRFGNDAALSGKQAAAQLVSSLLMRGTTTKSRQDVQDAMQKLDATVQVSGSLTSATATVTANAQNLVPALELAVEILSKPALAASDFDQIRSQILAAADRARTDPASLVNEALQTDLSPFPRGDVRHPRTIDEQVEDLKAVTLDDVKAFHRDFYGAS